MKPSRALLLLLGALPWAGCQRGDAAPPAEARVEAGSVVIPVELRLRAFADGDPPGHHLVTWAGGRAGGKALLRTPVADETVLDALERLGGRPGDTLSEDTWSRRDDPAHPAPDRRAEGSRVRLQVRVPGGATHDVAALLEDLDGRGFEWRLAGNRGLIEVWRSGCVVCLQSCPGAKVANRRATIRDLHRGRSRFRPSALARELGEGAQLELVLELVAESDD
jgi:hypothetical protein